MPTTSSAPSNVSLAVKQTREVVPSEVVGSEQVVRSRTGRDVQRILGKRTVGREHRAKDREELEERRTQAGGLLAVLGLDTQPPGSRLGNRCAAGVGMRSVGVELLALNASPSASSKTHVSARLSLRRLLRRSRSRGQLIAISVLPVRELGIANRRPFRAAREF